MRERDYEENEKYDNKIEHTSQTYTKIKNNDKKKKKNDAHEQF